MKPPLLPTSAERDVLRQRWYREGHFGTDTLADRLRAGAAAHPSTRMLFHSTERPAQSDLVTMYQRAGAIADGLWSLGFRPGDVLAVQVPNWLEGALTYQAAMLLGLVTVPIVHIYGPSEVGFILEQSGARGLVVPQRWRTIDYIERVEALLESVEIQHLIVIGDDRPANAVDWASLEHSTTPEQTHQRMRAGATVVADDPSLLIYTSGTTAEPKGVLHSHNTLITEVMSMSAILGTDAVGLAAFPAGHIADVLNVLRMFLCGTSYVLMDQWDPGEAAQLVEQHRVTTTAGAPFHLLSLMEAARAHGRDLSSLRGFMVGAASVPASLVEEADRFGIPAYRAYGSSEHPVLTSGHPSEPLSKRATTDGRLTVGNEIRIVDDHDVDVAPGHDGEIVCRGPEQFLGYTNPAHNTDVFLPGGWFRTGDIGRVDNEGHLSITDRKKDVIIRGGENIASKEVEDLLATMSVVLEAAVVGAPDPRLGERVYAFVLTRDGSQLDLASVQDHFRANGVARQKTPEFVETVTELPRGMSGKVKKVDLRRALRDRLP